MGSRCQQQRASLGRALVRDAGLYLLDEPMGQLEPQLRAVLRGRIKHYLREHKCTTILVTHDQTEANALADRIAVMDKGVIRQVGPSAEVYEHPNSRFVAGFIGSPAMNLFPGKLTDSGVEIGNDVIVVGKEVLAHGKGKTVTVGVRPEDLVVTKGKGLEVEIDVVEELGADGYLYGRAVIDGANHNVVVRVDGRNHPNRGEKVFVEPVAKHIHVFDSETGNRLSTAVVD